MTRLEIVGLCFSHSGTRTLFSDLDLSLEVGFTALVGANGSGKTSLLELVAGERTPDAGVIRFDPPGASVALCRQRVETADASIRSLAAANEREAIRRRAALALDPGSLERWATLSPGERKRWQVGAALFAEPDVLLLDEPTNHLDAGAREVLITALRRYRGVALLVSHDRALLDALCTRTLRIVTATRVDDFPGAYSAARAHWEREARARVGERELRRRELARKTEAVYDARREHAAAERRRSSRVRMKSPKDRDARGVGAKFRVARAESSLAARVTREEAARERAGVALAAIELEKELGRSLFVGYEPAPRPVLARLDVDGVAAGDHLLLRDVHVSLGRGDKVRIAGPNGAGKTTLLARLLDAASLPPSRVLYLPQHASRELGRAWLDELRGLGPEERGRVASVLAALGADPDRVLATREPSPGEARKLALASALGRHVWLLALDEPTNHLDLPSVERLEAALERFPGTILLVSHDDAFAARCTRATWRLEAHRLKLGDGPARTRNTPVRAQKSG